MQSSVRNQLRGTVKSSIVEGARDHGLDEGKEVVAVIKASDVLAATT